MLEQLCRDIARFDRIILHRHKNPDGDALGSQIGLKHLILDNFPGKTVYAVGDPAGRYAFMADSVMDEIPDTAYAGALAIILDTSAAHLISDDRYKTAALTWRLDHHLFCETIADHEITDSSVESCCGLVTALAMEAGLAVSPLAARSLYTGMVTDSGRFRYDCTTAATFARASFLLQTPFSLNDIYRELYADDLNNLRARAGFILRIRTTPRGTAYIYTTQEELAASGLDAFSASRGMVGTMADLRGIRKWVNFTETPDGVLCELRSSDYNINPIAVKYGGGGHAKASGATVPDRETAMQMLHDLDELE